MPSTCVGKPAKFERLNYVESLIYYDGDILAQYELDGDDWLMLWTDMNDLGTQYQDKHVFFRVDKQSMQDFLANKKPLYEMLEGSLEMWTQQFTWDHLPNGLGIPDTHQEVWEESSWAKFPDDCKPERNVCLRPGPPMPDGEVSSIRL